jgi:hypothetical protein
MKITLADKFIAYLALLSGLTISAVAIWYSVAGLVSIFAAAVTPIIVMGVALEVSKLIATVWLKLNWTRAPIFIRSYLLAAIAVLMVITSMGIFGFLSKAHSDQTLVSGDVQSKIAVYDEKIKTEKENIDANRKVLKQLDEAVDQVMGRSTDEKGAEKAVAIRKAQQKDRGRITQEIAQSQKIIATLNSERAPIAAEVRKVEAEVGPIKYIAAFIYGDNPDANVLERAVTWVIIIIVSVFDPLAVILLLASQYSFQWFRKDEEDALATAKDEPSYEPDDGPLTEVQIEQIKESVKDELPTGPTIAKDSLFDDVIPCHKCGTTLINAPGIGLFCPNKECDVADGPFNDDQMELDFNQSLPVEEPKPTEADPLDQWNKMIEAAEEEVAKEKSAEEILDEGLKTPTFKLIPELQEELKKTEWPDNPEQGDRCVMFVDDANRNFIFNGAVWIDADKSDQQSVAVLDESKKKSTYMIKDQDQQITKTKE